jgi:predicted flap endonuclease-1-like 5' DNA nuclease
MRVLNREEKDEMRTLLGVLIGLIAAFSGVILLAWLLWRLWTGDQEEVPAVIEIEVPEPEPVAAPVETGAQPARVTLLAARDEAPSEPEEADDLKVIEGIGPKISEVLREAGVVRFAQLAAMDADGIETILTAADPRLGRLADPGTWPTQAALAAEGSWEALASLQGELKRGRRA